MTSCGDKLRHLCSTPPHKALQQYPFVTTLWYHSEIHRVQFQMTHCLARAEDCNTAHCNTQFSLFDQTRDKQCNRCTRREQHKRTLPADCIETWVSPFSSRAYDDTSHNVETANVDAIAKYDRLESSVLFVDKVVFI